MTEGAQTVVGMGEGHSRAFDVKVGLHHGSVLIPLLLTVYHHLSHLWILYLLHSICKQMNDLPYSNFPSHHYIFYEPIFGNYY